MDISPDLPLTYPHVLERSSPLGAWSIAGGVISGRYKLSTGVVESAVDFGSNNSVVLVLVRLLLTATAAPKSKMTKNKNANLSKGIIMSVTTLG